MKTSTLDRLVSAVQAERARHEPRYRSRVFLSLNDATDLRYGLTARSVAGCLRSEKNLETLRQALGAASVTYRRAQYNRASGGGGGGRGFIRNYSNPASRTSAEVLVKFSVSEEAT